MTEDELVARLKELANDPKRRTGAVRQLPDLSGQPLPSPAMQEDVNGAETRMGFQLPALLRRLWTEVGNGGFGPGYGLFEVNMAPASELSMSLPNIYLQSIADESAHWPKSLVLICEWGCGYYTALDCCSSEGEMVNLLDELEPKRTGSSLSKWLEDWADGVDLWQRDFWRPG